MKPLHLKTPVDNKIKKTPTNSINDFKKYSFINIQYSKRNSSINNNMDSIISGNSKKKSVKSVKNSFR